MSARKQRERAEFTGYGWAALVFFLGMLTLGLLIGAGEWNFNRLLGLVAVATGAWYSWQRYERALRRKGRHTV